MTKTRQDKTADTVQRDGAVELNDAALDQAAGGTGATLVGVDVRPSAAFYGTGVYKTTDSGRGG